MRARIRQALVALLTLQFVSPGWRIPCFAALGVFVGLGLVVAHVSRAPSYLADSPETCINCHVMTTAYLTWQRSSHVHHATCNDCHVPHDNFINHYAYKARDGLWHATVFTMRWEPQVLQLSTKAIPVVEANCRRCHEHELQRVHVAIPEKGDHRCWDCHREVPHGRVRSLSATPPEMRPTLPPLGRPAPLEGLRIGGREVRPEPTD